MKTLIGLALLAVSTGACAELYRCGNTITDKPCSGATGATTGSAPVPIPPSKVPQLDTSGAGTAVVYLCRAFTSGEFFSSGPCGSHAQYHRNGC